MKFCRIISIMSLLSVSLAFAPITTNAASVDQIPNSQKIEKAYDQSFLSTTGYAAAGVHDRSEYIGTPYYRTVGSPREFLQAIKDAEVGKVKAIEITEDLNMGWKAIALSSEEQKQYSMIRKGASPSTSLTNPLIIESGVSEIKINNMDGLTIFSTTGKTIKHTEINIQNSSNDVVIRNLNFDGMWQWDDSGKHKEVGWGFIQVNGGTNVWIDHCKFSIAADGIIDLKNGGTDVTLSWNEFGLPADRDPNTDSSIYQSVHFMENQYQAGTLPDSSLYRQMRSDGATINDIMAYTAFHSKVHLAGSGDKDYVDYIRSNGEVVHDANSNIRLTMAYNHYTNVAQRLPMIRQGTGHIFNNYFDNSSHQEILDSVEAIAKNAKYVLSRGINSRNGASIAGDTNVYQAFREPLTGAERQGDDTENMNAPWDYLFQNAQNHFLLVNSKVTNPDGETYIGSSWDNNGDNPLAAGITWDDKSTIGSWAWSSSITGQENMDKENPPKEPFTFTYDYDEKLPYEYQTVPLDDVITVVNDHSGFGKIDMSAEQWLKTEYQADPEESLKALVEQYKNNGALDKVLADQLLYRISVIHHLEEQQQYSTAINYLHDFKNYISDPSVMQSGLITKDAMNSINKQAENWIDRLQNQN